MIYLIDDSVTADFLQQEEYAKIVVVIRDQQQVTLHGSGLEHADCLMVHRTFCDSSKVYLQVQQLASEQSPKIPFVVFSAGDSENAVYDEECDPYSIDGLKKSIFYERLQYFIDDFIANDVINLKILAYGKDYLRVQVRSWAMSIFNVINGKTGMLGLEVIPKLAACRYFKRLIDAAHIDYDDLLEKLEDEPITFAQFRANINNIVNSFIQYGKNIYTWK